MKVFQKVLIFVLLLLLAVTLAGFLLPEHYSLRREITIQAKPDAIFPLINRLSRWPEWSPWTTNLDPTMVYTYTGPVEGIGSISSWNGKKVGNGTMKLTASDAARGIGYDLAFNNGQYRSRGVLQFEPTTNGTQVIWTNEGDLGNNPINRYFGFLMDWMIGPDFAAGLAKLKLRAEAR